MFIKENKTFKNFSPPDICPSLKHLQETKTKEEYYSAINSEPFVTPYRLLWVYTEYLSIYFKIWVPTIP